MLQGSDEEGAQRMKRMIFITDSMTSRELDSDGTPFLELGKDGKPVGLTWRVTRVARGSGTSVREVEELLCQYRMMANMAKQAGGKNGWLQAAQKMQAAAGGRGRGANGMPTPAQIQAMQRAMPPGMLQQLQRQMRGGGGMQEMMKAMMQGQGGDQFDMEEMQSACASRQTSCFDSCSFPAYCRDDVANGRARWSGRSGRSRRWYAKHGRHVQDDGHGRWCSSVDQYTSCMTCIRHVGISSTVAYGFFISRTAAFALMQALLMHRMPIPWSAPLNLEDFHSFTPHMCTKSTLLFLRYSTHKGTTTTDPAN